MRHQKPIGVATLVLLAASLVLIAADDLVLPGVKHEPASCPICALAQCLAATQLPPPTLLSGPIEYQWLPPATGSIQWSDLSPQSFSARAPPSCIPA